MTWSKPEFVEISLRMEVSAYVNTDDTIDTSPEPPIRTGSLASVTSADGHD